MAKHNLCLMHKDIVVAHVTYNDYGKDFTINSIENPKHMPIGTHSPFGWMTVDVLLSRWNKTRNIPDNRPNCGKLMDKLGITSITDLVTKSYMCSLTDAYWFKSENDIAKWDDVNFHKNGFESNIGEMLFKDDFTVEITGVNSPDITTNGALPKMWIQNKNDGSHWLVKQGNMLQNGITSNHEAVSEVFASRLMKMYGIDSVQYYFTEIDGKLCCACKNFIEDDNDEFISMHNEAQEVRGQRKAAYQRFCDELGLKEGTETIQGFDYLVGNGDRHLQNIGYVRDSYTLEIKGVSPCYDTGDCMGYDYHNNIAVKEPLSKLYDDSYEVTLNKISNLNWFKNSSVTLDDIKNLYKEVARGKLDERVINEVLSELTKRYNRLMEIVKEKENNYNHSSNNIGRFVVTRKPYEQQVRKENDIGEER